MKSLNSEYLQTQPITQNLLQTIRRIAEYKGKQDLYKEQSPQILESLRRAAIIQSTESSNRLEGITAPLERIKDLVAKKTTPRNRSEQEIAGYRDILNTIHANHADIPFTIGVVLQFHRDLYQFSIHFFPGLARDAACPSTLVGIFFRCYVIRIISGVPTACRVDYERAGNKNRNGFGCHRTFQE